MVKNDKKSEIFIRLLRQAYHEKEKLIIEDGWQNNVMKKIRNLDMPPSQSVFFPMFENIVWRISPVIAIIIIIFSFALLNIDVIPDSEVFKLMYNGIEEYNLSKILAA